MSMNQKRRLGALAVIVAALAGCRLLSPLVQLRAFTSAPGRTLYNRPALSRVSRRGSGPDLGKLGEIMGNMPKMMDGVKKLQDMQKKLKDMPIVGKSMDGRVQVTFSGGLVPLGVEIDESVMKEVTAEQLSKEVLVAMRSAHDEAIKLSTSQLADVYGSMGIKVPGQADGGAAAAAPTPAKPKGKPAEFDPVGLINLDEIPRWACLLDYRLELRGSARRQSRRVSHDLANTASVVQEPSWKQ
eukprot:CAMPEP_0170612636 /NCGR_PEP_ID=MMETSP0224-20130122/23829_1 /TAXON_ID=285029 /ORGANISM="Togula jolla, Strain CCCM 725" /LENGTH=241 /DNA_ID=CAMNT_0010938153 /DNA_START=42 /DNA_END=765 /DNA_ORIENTATION=-